MRALVIQSPGRVTVDHVAGPVALQGQVIVDVDRVGVCGTDFELVSGLMPYLQTGHATFPLRPGHEWSGRVSGIGPGVSTKWLGTRVTADTMLGCQVCDRCVSGLQHLCEDRAEIGIRGGWPGALAEQVVVPATALCSLPQEVSAGAGALVEPGATALRAVERAAVRPGERVGIWGSGTIGLLAAQMALCAGAKVDVVGLDPATLEIAQTFGAKAILAPRQRSAGAYDVIIDTTDSSDVPREALASVEPGGRVVLVGLAADPSLADLRRVVLADLVVIGVLSGSGFLERVVSMYASSAVITAPLIKATVDLSTAARVLSGEQLLSSGKGPKLQIDPRLTFADQSQTVSGES